MKLKVCFCNKTVLRTDMTRYTPVWGGYTLFLAVMFLMNLTVPGETPDQVYYGMVRNFSSRAAQMVAVNGLYALIVVQALFGDMLNPRLCNSLHAMPVTRDGYYGAHLVAGLLFAFVPNLLVFLPATLIVGSKIAAAPLMTLLVACLQYIFYFGSALLAVQLAGNRIGMALAYGIVNFVSVLFYWYVAKIFTPMLYGMQMEGAWVDNFCPTVAMYRGSYFSPLYHEVYTSSYTLCFDGVCIGTLWKKAAVCAGIGLVCMAAGQLLYRRRKLESAGDLMAFSWLRPVFLVLYTLMVGAFFHLISQQYAQGSLSEYFFVPIGLLVGYVTGMMLLRRTSRVFRKRMIIPFACIVGVCVLGVAAIYTDVFHMIRWVPESQDISYVRLEALGSYGGIGGDVGGTSLVLNQPGQVEDVRAFHMGALENWQEEVKDSILQDADGYWTPGNTCNIMLEYHLNSGRVVHRRYPLDRKNVAIRQMIPYLSTPELAWGFSEKELCRVVSGAEQALFYFVGGTASEEYNLVQIGADMDGLARAILADFRAGNILTYSFRTDSNQTQGKTICGNLDISRETPEGEYQCVWMTVYPENTNILAYLETYIGSISAYSW